MFDYALFAAVAAVIREGSFERAARALHVTPSAVSQRVKLLEERLGSVLIVRGQPCQATEVGARVCRHAELVAMLEDDLRRSLSQAQARTLETRTPTLRIAVNADSLGTWFIDAWTEFARSEAALLDIAVDDQDYTADWLRRGEVLAAVTSLEEPVQGCRARRLGLLRYAATASPAFVEHHFAKGVNARSLRGAPMLEFNTKDRLQARWIRQVCRAEVATCAHRLPSTQAFVDAALGSIGWGMIPLPLARAHLDSGRLVELVPQRCVDVVLYWQHTRLAVPILDRLTACVVHAATTHLLAEKGRR